MYSSVAIGKPKRKVSFLVESIGKLIIFKVKLLVKSFITTNFSI